MRRNVPFLAVVLLVTAVWSSFASANSCSREEIKKLACSMSGFDPRILEECNKGAKMELDAIEPKEFEAGKEQDAKNFIQTLSQKSMCGKSRPFTAPGDLSLSKNIEAAKIAHIDNGSTLALWAGQCATYNQLCRCAVHKLPAGSSPNQKDDCKFDANPQLNAANKSFESAADLDKSLNKIRSSGAQDAMQLVNALSGPAMMMAQAMANRQNDDYAEQPIEPMAQMQMDPCTPGADGSSICAMSPPQTGQQATNDSWNKGSSAYAMDNNATGGSFNPTDIGTFGGAGPEGIPQSDPSKGGAMASGGVPNGGGGGIPGQGGATSASLGGGGAAGGAAVASSGRADILHGEGGASGFSAQNAAMNTAAGNGGGFGGYGRQAPAMNRLDLAKFLPGGEKDPTKAARGLAGVGSATYVQIQSKEVNIWNRISERIKSRCTQGLLKDCVR